MRCALISLLSLSTLLGCDAFSKVKVDNPVMPPPPPRTSLDSPQPARPKLGESNGGTPGRASLGSRTDAHGKGESIVPIDFAESSQSEATIFTGNEIVATVNGNPIFAGEILDPYGVKLAEARQQMPPEQFRDFQLAILRSDMDMHIERQLLVGALRAMLKPEQLDGIETFLDDAFEQQVERLKSKHGVQTRIELERKLREEHHTSLEAVRDAFESQTLALEYKKLKAQEAAKVGRRELFDYYERHIDDYTVAAQVKWQQLRVSFNNHGGEQAAFGVLEQAIAELKAGTDFGAVIREYSDGPKADAEGHWDWIRAGSLAEEKVEKVLFEIPEGVFSEVIVGDNAYYIVRVTGRKPSRRVPFVEVQDEIRSQLEQEARQLAVKRVVESLYDEAVIRTLFDDGPESADNGPLALPFR